MTQTEYEQKKRECWKEFTTMSLHKAFNYAYDRAYALGRQKEAITQEEIEKAAEKRVGNCLNDYRIDDMLRDDLRVDMINLFKDAVDFVLGKQEKDTEEAVISGWVFVDETTFDRTLRVRKVTQGDYEVVWDSGHPEFCLGMELYPDMVPNSLPEPVEIIIKRKKK